MGRNRKEALVFTSIMCFFMVLVMCFYNVLLAEGFSGGVAGKVAQAFLPALAVALILDVFIVGKIAKGVAGRILRNNNSTVLKILTISFFMVCGMALCMSLFGTVTHYGFDDQLLSRWLPSFGLNFIFALPLQLLLVGPLTRFLFMKLYQPAVGSH